MKMKVKTRQHRTTALPQWAQRLMRRLEKDLTDAKRTIATMHGERPSDVWFDVSTYPDRSKANLPPGVRVSFLTDTGVIEAHIRHGVLQLYTGQGRGLSIYPVSSNVVAAEIREHDRTTVPVRRKDSTS